MSSMIWKGLIRTVKFSTRVVVELSALTLVTHCLFVFLKRLEMGSFTLAFCGVGFVLREWVGRGK